MDDQMQENLCAAYQVDHLILLVGGNPLPNAVAAKLLLKPGGQASLLYTPKVGDDPGTYPIAYQLKFKLKEWWGIESSLVCVTEGGLPGEANPAAVRQAIGQALSGFASGRVGLNYTGGTKAMATHAYRAVERWAATMKTESPTYSYLDPRRMAMVFTKSDPSQWSKPETPDEQASAPVRGAFSLELQQLLLLHKWTIRLDPDPTPRVVGAAGMELLKAYAVRDLRPLPDTIGAWSEWVSGKPGKPGQIRRLINKHYDKRGRCWVDMQGLRDAKVRLCPSPVLNGVNVALRRAFALADAAEEFQVGPAADAAEMEPGDLCEWLRGKWLEHVVLYELSQRSTSLGLHDLGHGMETQDPQLEVDVVAMHGYQLFLFSCGTDTDKAPLKLKLFEARARARQLGGDEAAVALVCPYYNTTHLDSEMKSLFGDRDRTKVFGRQELRSLGPALEQWIRAQAGV